jgi:3-deoxy-D-manno-octulosonate cytidylyltransferase
MKKIALIPARYAATRFPFKLIQPLGDKTVIRHTYDNTLATGLFEEVWVITDSDLMSRMHHESGTDRIAEAALQIEADIILNVQGDEPFINRDTLAKLLMAFEEEQVKVASVMKIMEDKELISNPNYVKVTVDTNWNSLLFSRSVIPYQREKEVPATYYEHIGVYAFRKAALLEFTHWPMTPLETLEKIECLRFLEHGIPLKMVLTTDSGIKIDVPEDLEKAERYLQNLRAV